MNTRVLGQTPERLTVNIEASHMIRRGQVKKIDSRDSTEQSKFVERHRSVAA